MPYSYDEYLPSYEELDIPELEITSAVLCTAAHHLGKYCDVISKEYMLCAAEEKDPRKCLNEGKAVTRCGLEFLGKVKKSCFAEFNQYLQCIDHSGNDMAFKNCRKTQETYDNCIFKNLGQERPEVGYFSRVRLHDTERPRPQLKPHILPEAVPNPPDAVAKDSYLRSLIYRSKLW